MQSNTLYEKKFPMDSRSCGKALASTINAIDALMDRAPTQVKIIGIGLPGAVQPDGNLLGIPQIAVWEGFNLEKNLTSRYKAAVYVENDVKLSAMGYYYSHLSEKQDNLVYLYAGNGIGSGIILNGQLYRGSGNFSGEIGFMAETRGEKSATKRNYAARGGYLESYMSALIDLSVGKFKQQNIPARRKELIAILSTIAVNHVAVLNPDVIVLAGKIFDKSMVEDIGRHMANYLHAGVMPRITRDSGSTSGLEGLIQSCRGCITTGTQLIQSTGMTRQVERMAI